MILSFQIDLILRANIETLGYVLAVNLEWALIKISERELREDISSSLLVIFIDWRIASVFTKLLRVLTQKFTILL